MSKAFIFWLLMLLWVVFGCFSVRPATGQPFNRAIAGGTLLLFILLALLGWAQFGAPVK